MNRYVALLRGINVGGNNKISMVELKKAFEKNGFIDVMTYINSGNIVFSSAIDCEINIRKKCEFIIEENFKLKINVFIIASYNYVSALNNAPIWWSNDKDSKHNAIFVIPPLIAKDMVEEIGSSDYEKVSSFGQVIFWSVPIEDFFKTKWSKISSNSLYNNITIRNANTTKKLLEFI